MLSLNPVIHPDTKNKRFKFEPFLRREYSFGLDPDRPVCKFFKPSNPDSCPEGPNCPNKHIPSMYNNKIVCKHWLRGLCKKNDHCEFLHEYNFRKMPECLFYSKNGYCTQTPECLYLHVDPQQKIPECPYYARGFCASGPKCQMRHVRKILCPLYLTGFCPRGHECDYTHPKFDPHNQSLRLGAKPGKGDSREIEKLSSKDPREFRDREREQRDQNPRFGRFPREGSREPEEQDHYNQNQGQDPYQNQGQYQNQYQNQGQGQYNNQNQGPDYRGTRRGRDNQGGGGSQRSSFRRRRRH